MEIIHVGVTQITQDVTVPYKENGVIFCFSFNPALEELLWSGTAVLEGKFPIGPYISKFGQRYVSRRVRERNGGER